MSSGKYRAGAGTHEKWAVDKMHEMAAFVQNGKRAPQDSYDLRHELSEMELAIAQEKGIDLKGGTISDTALTKLAKAPDSYKPLLERMFDYEFAMAAVGAIHSHGQDYWNSNVFKHTVQGLESGKSESSRALAVQKLIKDKRIDLKLEKPEDRVSVGFGNRY